MTLGIPPGYSFNATQSNKKCVSGTLLVYWGQMRAVQQLVKLGAGVAIRDCHGRSALDIATERNS